MASVTSTSWVLLSPFSSFLHSHSNSHPGDPVWIGGMPLSHNCCMGMGFRHICERSRPDWRDFQLGCWTQRQDWRLLKPMKDRRRSETNCQNISIHFVRRRTFFLPFLFFPFLCVCVAYAFDCRQEPKQTFSNVQNHLECRAKLLTRSLWLSNWLKPKSTRYLLGGVVGVADCGENCFPFWRHYKSVKRHVDCFLRPDQRTSNYSFRCWVLGTYTPDSYTSHFVVPAGSPSSTEDKIYVYDINQPSLPLLSILFLCLFLSLWPFQLYSIQ